MIGTGKIFILSYLSQNQTHIDNNQHTEWGDPIGDYLLFLLEKLQQHTFYYLDIL